ncbi:MAG: aminotransferase class I/II-fold pyridoxal phosphate-dependent enzyme [Planctomycetota bacterium]|nr:aminotransferase class I/II-fold pyridoxal phosphate-dependent enzyme [Planctomycetota bacterium]MDI6786939.1 aminotransferase class I/II-fold pyridoxal phosphate-dependent enzyme [Planctomycetota bacterium]
MAKNIRAERLIKLPPYLFADFDRKRKEVQDKGGDIIDLSIGDPDLLLSPRLKQYLIEALDETNIHRYPPYKGINLFRSAISRRYKRKDISIDPEKEVWSLIGSKEGISHLIMAVVNPGDFVLLPNPGYPAYRSAIILAGGIPVDMPLLKENDCLPNLKSIKPSVARKTKLILLNYPNNPTAADAPKEFYEDVVRFAKKYSILVCQDAAYNEIYYNSPPVSFLSVKGAKDIGIEIGSFSKTFSIAGWRIGWAVGNREIISALGHIKTNIDSGVFMALQQAVARMFTEKLSLTEADVQKTRDIYKHRRNITIKGLKEIGLAPEIPQATFYVWLPLPQGWNSSMEFSEYLLTKLFIHTTPGVGFGKYGEGYIRLSLTSPEDLLLKALKRLRNNRVIICKL